MHTLFSMNVSLFVNNHTIFIAILTAIVFFPVNLSSDIYLNYYQWNSQTAIDYFPYFLYPWSIKKAFYSDGDPIVLISLAIQFLIFSFFLFSFSKIKSMLTNR